MFSNYINQRIRKIDTNGIITTYAGNGTTGFSGDGGAATSAGIGGAMSLAVDGSGNLFILTNNPRVRKVTPAGIITTVAGNGTNAYWGDGNQATAVGFSSVYGIAADTDGNLFITDSRAIRKVALNGIISTIAGGNDVEGISGDGGPALEAGIGHPLRLAADANNNLYLSTGYLVRKISGLVALPAITLGTSPTVCNDATSFVLTYTATTGNPDQFTITGEGVETQTGALTGTSGSITVNVYSYFTGSFSLVVANTTSNLTSTPIIGNVTRVGPPIIITGNREFCIGKSTTLTVGGGVSQRWYNGLRTPSITLSTAGVYSVTVTDADGCSSFTYVGVGSLPTPTATISGNLSICPGQSTTLTATGGTSRTWSTGATSTSISVNTAGTYFVTVTNPSGCTNSASATVTTFASPTATISGNLSVCPGQSTTLTAAGGTSQTWSTGATSTSIVASAAVMYSVTVVNANGCTNATSVTVTINPAVTATISGNLSICSGVSTTLTASGGTSYSWATGATTASISVSTTGAYSVTATANGCIGVTSTTVVNAPVHPDFAPLVDLFNATGGSQWRNKGRWLTNCDPCSGWYGVTCSGNRVVELRLANNRLTGPLPSSLSALTASTFLDFTENSLTGTIPPSIGSITSLSALSLYGNQLTGTIPNSFSSLQNIYFLDLSKNQLTGSIPASFSSLTGIYGLYLEQNQLTGVIPTSFSSLTGLTYLYLDNNQLTGSIPTSISSLTALEDLYLNNNQLTGAIPAFLGRMPNLGRLYLNNNQLTGSIPTSFSALDGIVRDLSLHDNQLSGCFPTSLTALCYLAGNGGAGTADLSNNPNLPGGGDFYGFCYNNIGGADYQPTVSISSTNVCGGSVVHLSVVGGTGYNWQGPASFTATTQAASFTAVDSFNSGTYSVTVLNGSNSCTATASTNLTVSTPTSITAQPINDLAVCAGNSVNLSIQASGTNLSYQWYRNGMAITGVASATTASLVFSNPTTTNSGTYWVVITGSCTVYRVTQPM